VRRVPLTRRNLLTDPRRLVANSAGVGLALMLILLLDGLWTGVRSQVTLYEDRVGAQLYVVAPGTRNLFADSSSLPLSALRAARATPGVERASPVRALFSILDLHGKKVAASVVGSVPGEAGGPWAMREGRPPRGDDEVVVDDVLARRHHLRIGSRVEVVGRRFRVVGISKGTAAFMTGFVFVTHAATDELLRSPGTTSVVLVGTHEAGAVRSRLEGQGLTVLDGAQLRAANLQLATKVFGVPVRLMVGVAFGVGTLVIALTAYASVVERRREYGIVKAMGASGRRLLALALGQTLGLAVVGLGAGGVFFVAGRALITWARPQFSVVLTTGGLARAAGAALGMALVAALVPARRLARLDPATAYRGT